jgi:MFS family permease
MQSPTNTPAEPAGGIALLKKFPGAFWLLNTIEMGERLAYYALRTVAPIYIMQADNPGGLHFTAADKASIFGMWYLVQSFLPVITGGIADRFGFKRTLACAISTIMAGYLMIAFMRDLGFVDNYTAFYAAIFVLAAGTAFFKPGIQGALALTLNKELSSVGWSLFYWVVNIGGFIGPVIATYLLSKGGGAAADWRNVFLAAAIVTGLNLILLTRFKDVPTGASQTKPLHLVLWHTIKNVFDPRLLCWLALMSAFWMMFVQLWDQQPNTIADWVDSAPQAAWIQAHLPQFLQTFLVGQTARGPQIPQQILINMNSFSIIVCVVFAGYMTRRMRTLSAMLIGMVMIIIGIVVAGMTMNVWVLLFGILFFSFGEMTVGPKQNEYLALIAPPGKKGLYLGYNNIPTGIGGYIGAKLAGHLYGEYGEKATLALRYIADETPYGAAKNWDGNTATLEAALGITRSEAMIKLQELTQLDPAAATRMLWEKYTPHLYIWLPFAVIGAAAAIGLFIFARMARRWSDMDA